MFDAMSFHGGRSERRLAGIDDEHGEQTRPLRRARILAHAMPVTGHSEEALSGLVDHDRPVIHLAADGALQHGRVDEPDCGWVCAGEEPPGAYSTSTPLKLLPGMLG